MARPLRIEFDGAWYHVMNRGAGKRPVFRTPAHRAMFLRLVGDVSRIYRVQVHAYCLMGNHYHLQVHTPRAGLSRAMRHLNGVYTQRFNKATQSDGPLFRGRYRAVLINADSHLCCVSRYIHLNPVEAGLVNRPEDYPDSSYRAYLGLAEVLRWLHTGETLGRFAPGDSVESYRRFVESGLDTETRKFYDEARQRPVLGSDEFRRRVQARLRRDRIGSDPEIPDRHRLGPQLSLPEIGRAVCHAFSVPLDELRSTSRRPKRSSLARGAMVLLSREIGGHSLGAIAQWIGYRSYASASKAMSRLGNAIGLDLETRDRLSAARGELCGDGRQGPRSG